jgi:prepilin-type N-terminal cleavage/methylation domain-containing protein
MVSGLDYRTARINNMRMKGQKAPGGKETGFSLLELLIALIILTLLALMVIPTWVRHVNDAKETAAMAELKELAKAEQAVLVDTGYYVTLDALQAHMRDDGTVESIYEFASNHGAYVVDPTSGELLFTFDMPIPNRWNGPYLAINNDKNDDFGIEVKDISGAIIGDKVQDDPWGSSYILISWWDRTVFPPSLETDFTSLIVDRFYVLSKGQNGVLEFGTADHAVSDDLVHPF